MVIMLKLWNGATRLTVAVAMGQLILATTPVLAQERRDSVALDQQFTAATSAPLSTEPWWETLGDPFLRQYVEDALTGNYDLTAATYRIAQAEATAVRARAPILPSLSLDAQGSTGPLSTRGFALGGIPRQPGVQLPALFYTGNAALNLRYRLDAWGQEYLAYQASKLQAMASRGDGDGVALALISQIAEAYLDAVMAKQQIAIIERQIESSRQLEALTQRRFEVGEATALTVLQQRQQLASTRANLPPAAWLQPVPRDPSRGVDGWDGAGVRRVVRRVCSRSNGARVPIEDELGLDAPRSAARDAADRPWLAPYRSRD